MPYRTVLLAVVMATGCNNKTSEIPLGEASRARASMVAESPLATSPHVVIVGAGISGLSAALELGQGGANVTVVDISSVFGGHAVMSQGAVSLIGTPMQRQAGLKDSADLAFKDFIEWGEGADQKWVRYYVDHSCHEIYDWLLALGVQFSDVLPTPGNSVDRNHQPEDRGIGLVTPIYQACLELDNIHFLWNTRAEKLLVADSRVIGIETFLLRGETTEQINADIVILATGGFQNNLQMVREFWPRQFKFPQKILVGSGRHSIGLGHEMAQRVGGNLVHMDYQWNYFTGVPDPHFPGTNRGLNVANMSAILVDADGKRFANLHGWVKQVMPPLLAMDQVTCWFIFDEATRAETTISGSDWANFEKVDRLILQNSNLVQKANTIEELGKLAGLPENHLVETVQRYNQLVEQGKDIDFGRFGPGATDFSNSASPKLETPPFYAMQTYPLTRKSMGGVAIDMNCRVVDREGAPISGLYAIGELTGLALINGKASLEGTFLGPCMMTGRVAARSILQRSRMTSKDKHTGSRQCIECHDIDGMLAQARSGYWHFEQVHAKTIQNNLQCSECHGELVPYRKTEHRIDPHVLTTSCKKCHTGRE